MKLVYCPECGDVFQLRIGNLRHCDCGKCSGMYTDHRHAVTNGYGMSIAIGNGSLHEAMGKLPFLSHGFYPIMCWARKNSGAPNPHSTVNKTLGE